jgi:WD40 repeat protein
MEISIWNWCDMDRAGDNEQPVRHTRGAESVVYSPDGSLALFLPQTNDSVLRVLNTQTLKERLILDHLEPKKFVIGAIKAKKIVAATKTRMHVWTITDNSQDPSNYFALDLPGPSINTSAAVQPSTSGRGTIQAIMTYEHACTAIDISNDGKKIVSASNDFIVWVWCAETKEHLLKLEHPKPERAARAAFSNDDSKIVTSANNSAIHVWDANSGERLYQFPLATDLGAISFSVDDRHIIGSRFRFVKQVLVWEASADTREPLCIRDGLMHWTKLSNGVSYTYKDGWIWEVKELDSSPQRIHWIPLHYRPNVKAFGPVFTPREDGRVQVCLGREDGMVTLTFVPKY